MPNNFLGFPVPYAKIAGMLKKKVDKSDELSLPFEDFYYETCFESIDGYATYEFNSGTVSEGGNQLMLDTGATANSIAQAYSYITNPIQTLTFAKERIFQIGFYATSLNDNIGEFWMISGETEVNYVGFKIIDGVLYGTTFASGGGESTLEIETLGDSNFSVAPVLKAHFKPGNECRFFVDGVDRGNITTNLPSAVDYANMIMNFKVRNHASAHRKYIGISQAQIWQAA